MALILQRLRDSQPQDFAPADLSAPINQGAVEVFSFGGNGLRGAVRGYAGTVQSGAIGHSVLSVAGVGARSIAFDGATWLDFPAAVGAFGTGEFSVTVIFRATAGHLFGNNESAVAGGWLLYKSGTKLVINQNDAFSLNLSTTTDVYDGALHCVTITRSSGGYYQWMVDGRLDNGSAGTLLSVSSGKSPVLGGQRNGASSAGALLNGDVAFVALHNRAISLEDHRSYSRSPWRGLSGPRIYIPGAAAGGPGSQSLTPTLYSNAQTFYTPTVSTGAASLAPTLYSNAQTFYAPTVTQGAVSLAPTLYSNTQAFYSATVTQGAVLAPALYSNSQAFYAPTVSAGAVTLTPALYSNAQSFYSATVLNAGQILAPGLYSNSQAFYAPTVGVGAVTLTPALFTNSSTFYAASVSDGAASAFIKYFDVLSGKLLILRAL